MGAMMKPRGLPGMGPAMMGMGGGGPDFLAALGGGPGPGPGKGPGGPATLPPGGSLPPDGDTAGSPLLAALAASLGDPYAEPGVNPTDLNVGTEDPQMGLEGLLELLSMAMAGAGGGAAGPPRGGYAAAGKSGVDTGTYPMGQAPGY